MATVRVRIAILRVRITLSVCPFNRMAHTANRRRLRVDGLRSEKVQKMAERTEDVSRWIEV
jgi:hypothetical protein